ncbi:hypothetical protein CEXT_763431 [Caerostris extrusa]|uniref:Uncharacterized protein n=1 Tax=Caerostris extrusa TaxID=172846 RepID=A0AAV4WS94_CAEEX|nr:hypothetical protein CEXT_763431 [Caerostris extrusa]
MRKSSLHCAVRSLANGLDQHPLPLLCKGTASIWREKKQISPSRLGAFLQDFLFSSRLYFVFVHSTLCLALCLGRILDKFYARIVVKKKIPKSFGTSTNSFEMIQNLLPSDYSLLGLAILRIYEAHTVMAEFLDIPMLFLISSYPNLHVLDALCALCSMVG